MIKVFVAMIFIWAGYTAGLIIGGAVCLLSKLAVTFFNVWGGLFGVIIATFIMAVLSEIIKGGKK